jgi:glycosyltransferase involved in cell wall biosynthesis
MKELDVLLVDPSISSGNGHHYTYLNQHRFELRKLGVNVNAFVQMYADDDFVQQADVIKGFTTSLHARTTYTWDEFVEFANNFERDISAVVEHRRLRPDLVLLPTADQSMILGLAQYLSKIPGRHRPEVLIWILTSPHHLKPSDDPSIGPLLAEYKEAFAKLCDAMRHKAHLHIYTEADAMAAVYQPYCDVKIETVTVRKRLQRPRPPRMRRPGERINAVCVGVAAKTKGYELLPEAIHRLNEARNDLRFSIHGTVNTGFAEAKSILESLPMLGANVKVSTDSLSPEDYIAWLSEADIAMLPYDTYVYRTHGSAVFDEATGLGIPVVAPKDCDFAKSAIAEGRAVGIENMTAEGLANAVGIAADHLDELADRAARYAASRDVDTSLRDTLAKAVKAAKRRVSLFEVVAKRWRRRQYERDLMRNAGHE